VSLILRRSLIFIGLLAGGLVLYSLWYGIRADRYDETAIPYMEAAIPRVSSWQFEQLEPLLSPGARLDFNNEKLRAAYQSFSKLGQYQSMDRPRYKASSDGSSTELGKVEVIDYQVELQFDSGPAMLKIKLVADGDSYYVHHFGFHSDIFATDSDSQ